MICRKPRITGHFNFVRVMPRDDDYFLLFRLAKELDLFVAYKTVNANGRAYLVGVFVLKGQRMAAVSQLTRFFPNFLLSTCAWSDKLMGSFGRYDSLIGTHPLEDVRKELFT